jgi:hypothetical protein
MTEAGYIQISTEGQRRIKLGTPYGYTTNKSAVSSNTNPNVSPQEPAF